MATLYYSDINSISLSDQKLLARLTPERLAKMERFHFEADKRRSLVADLLIYNVYKDLSAIQVGVHNKPYIPNALPFNVSHSGDYAILLVGDGEEVGCDIERHDTKDMSEIAERILQAEEFQYYLRHKDKNPNLFYAFWTLKESYMKCVGKGFALSPQAFAVKFNKKATESIELVNTSEANFQDCVFQLFDFIPDYTLATCRQGQALTALKIEKIEF